MNVQRNTYTVPIQPREGKAKGTISLRGSRARPCVESVHSVRLGFANDTHQKNARHRAQPHPQPDGSPFQPASLSSAALNERRQPDQGEERHEERRRMARSLTRPSSPRLLALRAWRLLPRPGLARSLARLRRKSRESGRGLVSLIAERACWLVTYKVITEELHDERRVLVALFREGVELCERGQR